MPAEDDVLGTHSKFRPPSDDAAHFASAQLLHTDWHFGVVEHERHDVARTMPIHAMRFAGGVFQALMPRHHAHCAELNHGV
jgi:hypothetical protein